MITECKGIAQSDVLIRAGLVAGLAELRREPWLLDFVFAGLAQDDLTSEEYGQKEVDQAARWFMATKIPVVMNYRIDEPTVPAISIALLESAEVEQTLADVNYKPTEETEADWPLLAGPFSVEGYSPRTGVVTLPKEVGDALVVVEGMFLIDDVGGEHEILAVEDRYKITIGLGLNLSFSRAAIRSARPTHVVQLESCNFRETYQVGVHASGEPSRLLYLYSITMFVLLRMKQELLEKRGLERTILTAQQVAQNPNFDGKEIVWSRFINIQGHVRNFWPKLRVVRTRSISVEAEASPVVRSQSQIDSVDSEILSSPAVSIFTPED